MAESGTVRVRRPGGALGGGPRRSVRPRSTTVPPWCSVIALTIDRPRPSPPASRARPSSRRVNRSNTSSRSSAGMPGPSSSTVSSTTCSSVVTQSDRDRRARVARRVVEEVADDALQLVAPTVHTAGGHAAGVDGDASLLHGVVEHQLVEVDLGQRVDGCRTLGLVEAREVEQLADRVLHAHVLGQRTLARPRASRRGRGCAARPRGWCGSTPAGCAARATRRRRTAVAAAPRSRAGRASRSSCGRGGRPRRRCRARGPAGASWCR